MSTGYTYCQACGGDTIGALCEWCRLGALENNDDPDSISQPDFNTRLLAVWCASGEAIADREDAEARQIIDDQDKRGTGFDRASWGAR